METITDLDDVLRKKEMWLTLRFLKRWKFFLCLLVPIFFLPVLSLTGATPQGRCAYLLCVLVPYWVLGLIPIPVASLMPVFLCPLLGVLDSDHVCAAYMHEINVLMMGSLACALAIEYCKLHRRMALRMLMVVGVKPRWMLLGFMVTGCFLSMWINNTSAVTLVVPICESVLNEAYRTSDTEETGPPTPADEETMRQRLKVRRMTLLGIAFSCTLGGTGTLTGTGANMFLYRNVEKAYTGKLKVEYFRWMLYAMPLLIISIALVWLLLQIIFLGFKATFTRGETDQEAQDRVTPLLTRRHNALGKMTYHEVVVIILYIILVSLWIFRDPGFIDGWSVLWFPATEKGDSIAPIFILLLMFIIPQVPDMFCKLLQDRSKDPQPLGVLEWFVVQNRLAWGVLLVMGGGFALSDACQHSGLTQYIATKITDENRNIDKHVLLLLTLMVTAFVTNLTSNTASAALLLPIVSGVAWGMRVHPFFLMIPVTMVCSYAFMLPISTPPNAIVWEKGGIRIHDMALAGFVIIVVLVLLQVAAISVWGPVIWKMDLTTDSIEYRPASDTGK